MREISRIKNIPVSCISRWVSNRNNLENPLYSNKFKKLPGEGKKSFTLDYEIHLCKYIDNLRKLDIPVTTIIVIIETINTITGFIGKTYNA